MRGLLGFWFSGWANFAQWRQRRLIKRASIWAARTIRWNFKAKRRL